MTPKTNRKSTDQIISLKKFSSEVNPKGFTREQTQTITPINTEIIFIDKSKNIYSPGSKWQKYLNYDHHHWGANRKMLGFINKREKSPETLRLIDRLKEIIKPGNHRFKFDSTIDRKVWLPQRPKKWGTDEVAGIDLELLFRRNVKNQWGERYFEIIEPKLRSSKEKLNTLEQSTIQFQPKSKTEEN